MGGSSWHSILIFKKHRKSLIRMTYWLESTPSREVDFGDTSREKTKLIFPGEVRGVKWSGGVRPSSRPWLVRHRIRARASKGVS